MFSPLLLPRRPGALRLAPTVCAFALGLVLAAPLQARPAPGAPASAASAPDVAPSPDLNAAINQAGRLQTLAERMAKLYLQVGQKIETDRSQRQLAQSVEGFDAALAELRAQSLPPLAVRSLQNLERRWVSARPLLARPDNYSIVRAGEAMQAVDQLATLAEECANTLESSTASPSGHLVNLSGRMRTLSQRMARLHQMHVFGVGAVPNVALLDKTAGEFAWKTVPELAKASEEFKRDSKELKTSLHTPQSVQSELELMDLQWMFFEKALAPTRGDERLVQSRNIATTSERMLESLDRIVTAYERLGR